MEAGGIVGRRNAFAGVEPGNDQGPAPLPRRGPSERRRPALSIDGHGGNDMGASVVPHANAHRELSDGKVRCTDDIEASLLAGEIITLPRLTLVVAVVVVAIVVRSQNAFQTILGAVCCSQGKHYHLLFALLDPSSYAPLST